MLWLWKSWAALGWRWCTQLLPAHAILIFWRCLPNFAFATACLCPPQLLPPLEALQALVLHGHCSDWPYMWLDWRWLGNMQQASAVHAAAVSTRRLSPIFPCIACGVMQWQASGEAGPAAEQGYSDSAGKPTLSAQQSSSPA